MKSHFIKASLLMAGMVMGLQANAQIQSFEGKGVPDGWNAKKGKLSIASNRYKLGERSLLFAWKSGATLRLDEPQGLAEASASRHGGISTWIYNEEAVADSMHVQFADAQGKLQCTLPISLNFTGWRCVWVKFQEDLGLKPKVTLASATFVMPKSVKKGNLYFDYFSFEKTISWQRMSDFQYEINRTDFALVHDLLGYRLNQPKAYALTEDATKQAAIDLINERLHAWYLGEGKHKDHPLYAVRAKAEDAFVSFGLKKANEIKVAYAADGTPIGQSLHPLYATKAVEGEKLMQFLNLNKDVLLPLAFDYHKNGNEKSLEKAHFIFDWMHDQGWADGSAVGTLTFEKLRTAGYFHTWALLNETLPEEAFAREQATMNWLTLFGSCYNLHDHPGEVADNLRALALPKLAYALSLKGNKREVAMQAFHEYINLSLGLAPGYYGTFKPDYSGYHHRAPYNSAYYPHALYAGSLIAYLLHDTPYALSDETMTHLKNALLSFRFFSANLSVPAATTGRFPTKQVVLQDLVPAYAYAALSFKEADQELLGAMKRIVDNHPKEVNDYFARAESNLSYTSSMGEVEAVLEALAQAKQAEASPVGSKFMPYSGLLVVKNPAFHLNVKGTSRYIWDFESSASENLYGRYISHGNVEVVNLTKNIGTTHWGDKHYAWSFIPGTTTKVLANKDLVRHKGKKLHRTFTDESFLAGVTASEQTAMFSLKLHDTTYDPSFRANKSVFTFDQGILCLGSDIEHTDKDLRAVTTLMQAPHALELVAQTDKGVVYVDRTLEMAYVVIGAQPTLEEQSGMTRLYIDHGVSPNAASYQYLMIPASQLVYAQSLVKQGLPYRIEQADKQAQRVRFDAAKTTYAALFEADVDFAQGLVSKVNIPLAYIAQEGDAGAVLLSICEPDMRRAYRKEMNQLKDDVVTDASKPHQTVLTLNGNYDLSQPAGDDVHLRQEAGKTVITLTTIDGQNRQLALKKK